jgi:glycosyltransferase involved in cell wall biosynthesis
VAFLPQWQLARRHGHLVGAGVPGMAGKVDGEFNSRTPGVRSRRLTLRIVYLWDADYPWDVRTQKVCAALSDAGHEVHIVARNRSWRPLREQLAEGLVHRMRPWHWLGRAIDNQLSFPAFCSPRWINHLHRVTREVGADIIIARDLPLCPTAIYVGRKLGVPVVFDMAENYPAMMREIWDAGRQQKLDVVLRNPRLVAAVERWCAPRVDATLVVVRESGERLESLGVPAQRIALVSNTPPRSRVLDDWEAKHYAAGPLQLVYLGLLEIPRGVGELLEATALLRDQSVDVQLRIVGDGRDRGLLEQQARERNLDTRHVEFLGRLEHADALAVVASSQVGIVPHHADEAWNTTIPNKLFDYMAAGLAVISSDAAPPTRILEETGAGVIFEAGNARSLAAAILQVRESGVRVALGAAGRMAVLDHYNWETETARMLRMLEQVAPGAAAVAPRPRPRAAASAQRTTLQKAVK